MDNVEQFIKREQIRSETFGNQACHALYALLWVIDHHWKTSFLSGYKANSHAIRSYLHSNDALAHVLRQIFETYQSAMHEDTFLEDPTALVDFITLTAFLADEYPAAFPSDVQEDTRKSLELLQRQAASSLIAAVGPQVEALSSVAKSLSGFLECLVPSPGRLFLLEFPVGNTLPTRVLKSFLETESRAVEIIRVALTRNDKRALGVTRRQILENRLAALGVTSADVVILLDEWISGSNFRNVVQLIARNPTIREASFLPVGLLTETSHLNERFSSHVEEHDGVVQSLGESGSDFRFVFPALATRFERNGYFFWAEHDRLSGLRKLQTFGGYLSALEAGIQEILKNPKSRRRARFALAAELDRSGKIPNPEIAYSEEFLADGGILDKQFEESCEDFESCKNEIHAIVPASARGEDVTIEQENADISSKLHKIVDPRSALICVFMAEVFMESEQMFDTPDPYYLEGHAPAVCDLDGAFGRLRDFVIEETIASIRLRLA